MLLYNDKKCQVVLEKNPLTKQFSVTVYNKVTKKKRVYVDKKMIKKLICKYI